jgi:Cu(I)/Ag(I) efflux system membrane protein CusA/SilA
MTPPLPQLDSRVGLIGRIVAASARNPMLTIALVAALAVWGWYSLRATPLDAIPDLSDTQVIVLTEWPGQSPDLVENQVTYPVSSALLSTPRARVVRGQSSLGLSFVYVIFEDGTDLYWARSRVSEALARIEHELPSGVRPTLGPDATSVGWVLEYALKPTKPVWVRPDASVGPHKHKPTEHHDAAHERHAKLRSFQDWNLR